MRIVEGLLNHLLIHLKQLRHDFVFAQREVEAVCRHHCIIIGFMGFAEFGRHGSLKKLRDRWPRLAGSKTNSKFILKTYDKNLLQSNDHSKNCEIPNLRDL